MEDGIPLTTMSTIRRSPNYSTQTVPEVGPVEGLSRATTLNQSRSRTQEADPTTAPTEPEAIHFHSLEASITPPELGGVDPRMFAGGLLWASMRAAAGPSSNLADNLEADSENSVRKVSYCMVFASVVFAALTGLCVYALTIAIVEPVNRKKTTENNDITVALCVLALVVSTVCTFGSIICIWPPRWPSRSS